MEPPEELAMARRSGTPPEPFEDLPEHGQSPAPFVNEFRCSAVSEPARLILADLLQRNGPLARTSLQCESTVPRVNSRKCLSEMSR